MVNNSIENMNSPTAKYHEVVYEFSHFKVKAVCIIYLIAIKL